MILSHSKFKIPHNPYILFLPFLLFYILIVLYFQPDDLWGDQDRYIMYAQNLLQGYFSKGDPNLSSGPGYPVILMPFVGWKLPLVTIRLMNPFFYYLSVVFLFKTIQRITSFKIAAIGATFWACYFNSYENFPLILTETFSIFLVSLSLLWISKAFDPGLSVKSKKFIYLSGFLIGYLALTKVIFGYVILVMLIGALFLWFLKRTNHNLKRVITILMIAFLTTTPYLIYTYSLTGRIFYWTTVSGNNLYWMTTPYEGEYGNWSDDLEFKNDTLVLLSTKDEKDRGGIFNVKNRVNTFQDIENSIKLNHEKDFRKIYKYRTAIDRDDAFKRIAIENIKAHPKKYVENWFSNIGRILFNYPYSFRIQSPGTLLRLPMSGIIVVLILFSLIPTLMNWRKIDFVVRFFLLFCFIYLGGSSLVNAEARVFTIVVPMLVFWIIYIMNKSIRINFKF